MFRKWLVLGIWLGFGSLASAQVSASENACNTGDAEACFYTGAEYAQGSGVAEDKQKAVTYFLKACDMGVPDGCSTSGILVSLGEGNLEKDVFKGVDYLERACGMGHVDGCSRAIGHRISDTSPAFDLQKAVEVAKAGCAAGVENPCYWGLDWSWDGKKGEYPSLIDMPTAGWFAEEACNQFHDMMGCDVAARLYADPDAATFDAEKGLTYSMIRCDEQKAGAHCRNVGGVYLSIEEYELGALYMRRACDFGHADACQTATDWETYNREMAEYEAKMAAYRQMVDTPLSQGRYGDAVSAAINSAGSKDLAEKAILATRSAGRMSDISTNDLYAAALWFPTGPVRAAADAELAARGTGLEGTFGTGTNAPGMADARWRELYGTSAPSYSSGSSSFKPAPMKSASQISAETREKYRWAHCTMKGSNTSATVCQ
ncbi:tetratricopeptide repeat protein [Hyphomonas jannaschiana]|uniref:Beta-lactamase family protein n=1 Tax=Hyphomonas jannaschiana VP2 TaxID=1280952 RepID=A0A059FGN4_9PROT|nr:tetratricopeptide repeat protein [Hyphomonas jannaschiana]KCZ89789.1 beta-lactamase family protein [Hyphomonas jannaschiana VP2]